MKNVLKISGVAALAAVIGFVMITCAPESEEELPPDGGDPIAVTGVTLSPATLNLTVGGSAGTLTATVAPANAANKAVTWSTNNAAVATVSGGTVTAVGAGTAVITVKTTDGNFTASCAVTVTTSGGNLVKTVSVGTQVGILAEKTAGTVTYPVTTANIADGIYYVSVENRPTGVSVSGQVTISDNAGTLTLAGSTIIATGTTDTLTLTLNGATSGTFSITILGKTVSVGAQVGTLAEGTAGTVTYPVTTVNIADGAYSATVANRPLGVTVSGQVTISGNAGTLTLAGSIITAAGTADTLTLTLNGATSGTFSITILAKTVSVGAQVGTLAERTAGTVTFPVTTVNIANGTYTVTVANRPSGVTVSGQVTISDNAGTLTLASSTYTPVGTADTLTLTLDGATSGTFSIVITPHDHSYITTWSSNAAQHWKECTDISCDAKTETANHAPANGVCTTCGYDNMLPHTHNWDWASYVTGSGLRECQTDGCSEKAGVGDKGPAGIIIYVATSGFTVQGTSISSGGSFEDYTAYYLEAAPANQATSVRWSLTDKNITTTGTGTEIGTGKANTFVITRYHSSDTASDNAAKTAAAYSGGGKNDWFLPSKDELNAMYEARTHLSISSGRFWSSSQYFEYNHSAWEQDFTNGHQTSSGKYAGKYNVRAVRAF